MDITSQLSPILPQSSPILLKKEVSPSKTLLRIEIQKTKQERERTKQETKKIILKKLLKKFIKSTLMEVYQRAIYLSLRLML